MERTIADTMREKALAKANAKREKYDKTNEKYACRIISREVLKATEKGFMFTVAKIPNKYSATKVSKALEEKGFGIDRISKNGKQSLRIKW